MVNKNKIISGHNLAYAVASAQTPQSYFFSVNMGTLQSTQLSKISGSWINVNRDATISTRYLKVESVSS
ncbi:hypothetical protein D7322_25430 [Sphingobacterium puteale]|uniref:Uncharacterized protein n=1 Tax=Sphingobacterium puteale TaxID=2420510 RepID=A0A420VQV9_9SPHI|nr:hypothetical protein D7322_25430 [Sphingobacterium puteale]